MLHPDRSGTFLSRDMPRPGSARLSSLPDWPDMLLPPGWWLAPAIVCGAAIWVSGVSALVTSLGG